MIKLKSYKFNDLVDCYHLDCLTIANNTLIHLDDSDYSPEGGLSEYITILLYGHPIYKLESYRHETVSIKLLPDAYKWLTFLTTTRINLVCMSYGYKCHRDLTNKVYNITTTPNRKGKIYNHVLYPDSYPLLLTPYYHDDWCISPERGYIT